MAARKPADPPVIASPARPEPDKPHPVRHPQIAEVFERDDDGGYHPRNTVMN